MRYSLESAGLSHGLVLQRVGAAAAGVATGVATGVVATSRADSNQQGMERLCDHYAGGRNLCSARHASSRRH